MYPADKENNMNAAQAREYFKSQAIANGLTETEIADVLKGLENDKVATEMLKAFVPRTVYSKDLNDKDTEAKDAKKRADTWEQWHKEKGEPAYQANLKGIDTLRKYIERYGAIEDGGDLKDAVKKTGMTIEEVTELLDKRLQDQSNRFVGLTKDAVRISNEYRDTFGKSLDVDAVEDFALKNNLSLRDAYNKYVSPQIEEKRSKEFELKLKQARDEGYKEGTSKSSMPTSRRENHDEPHPLFDQERLKTEATKDGSGDRAGREAFLDAWNNAEELVTK